MGSLTSRPKSVSTVPTTQVIYVPATTTSSTTATSSTSTSSGSGTTDTSTDPALTAEVREQNLLTRSRSRLGTVTTSFRGLLGLASQGSSRKTLLGE